MRGQKHFVVHAKTGRKLSYGDWYRSPRRRRRRSERGPFQDAERSSATSERTFRWSTCTISSLVRRRFGIDATDAGHGLRLHRAAACSRRTGTASTIQRQSRLTASSRSSRLRLAKPPYGFKPLGGVGRHREQQLGRNAGPQEAEGRMEPGRQRQLRIRRVQKAAARYRAEARTRAREVGNVDASSRRAARSSKPPTTRRCWRTRRWSRPPRSPIPGRQA